ncbi:MAG: hypothetical protein Q9M28_09580 [Mariprofundaceae bacterium]|nr:hypothetical protein [Mariprofundaceae bacterium]
MSSTGAFGYIKANSLKSLQSLAVQKEKTFWMLIPLHPLKKVHMYHISQDLRVKKRASFSRSTRVFVVSNGQTKKVETSEFTLKTFLKVRYFIWCWR